jgi:hypothetical protein
MCRCPLIHHKKNAHQFGVKNLIKEAKEDLMVVLLTEI